MRLALEQADVAGRRDEVPVGAVVVMDGRVVGTGANAPISRSDPTAHAEVLALREAGAAIGNYRLAGATLYCTVEPCLMCLTAALHARIDRLVFGAADPKVGAVSRLDELRAGGASLNHRFAVTAGVLADESSAKLRTFFQARRD
jgi:tRNA(adenine34) deaminase